MSISDKITYPYPSVQSFYKEKQKNDSEKCRAPFLPGDGFTNVELEKALDPLKHGLNGPYQYERCRIDSLGAGPQLVTFTGKVINVSTHMSQSKSPSAAAGWHNVIVKDNAGAIHVKIFFTQQPYVLRLGHLLTVWTPFISLSSTAKGNVTLGSTPLTTSIFPRRNASDHMIIHEATNNEDTCHVPFNYQESKPLPGLMALKGFIQGGHEVSETKILVCVKSIGMKKNITSSKGAKVLVEVVVFDDTAEITLKVWDDTAISARDWSPRKTVLLISGPVLRFDPHGRGSLGLTHSTLIEVDPNFADANWLKKYAANIHRRECVKQEFPENIWDLNTAMNRTQRLQFTIADVDEFVRSDPTQTFIGLLSLTILDMSLSLNYRRNMLMCTECCGVPVYDNFPESKCKNCEREVMLELNPKVMGTFIDETGGISPGKLLWSRRAWEGLFRRRIEELVKMDHTSMEHLEQQMLFQRITLICGWAEEVGKLAVLAVRS